MVPGSDLCSHIFSYQVFFTSNTGHVENKVLSFNECGVSNCSTELDVDTFNHSDVAASYRVSMLSSDVYGYHEEGPRVDFDGDVGEWLQIMHNDK